MPPIVWLGWQDASLITIGTRADTTNALAIPINHRALCVIGKGKGVRYVSGTDKGTTFGVRGNFVRAISGILDSVVAATAKNGAPGQLLMPSIAIFYSRVIA
jgi:hypothetical protein